MSKKQHSTKWWNNHWDIRDRCGSYTDVDHLSGPAGDECKREDGHQAARAKKRDPWGTGKGRGFITPRAKASGGRRAQLREEMGNAKHAQFLREEAATGGNKAERRAFYGSIHEHQDENAERRLTTAQADHEAKRQAEHDREQAEAYRARQAAKKQGRKAA